MQQKGVVCLGLGRHTELEARVEFLVFRIPVLRIGWVRHHGINKQRVVGLVLVLHRVEPRPVVLERVAVSGHDVVGKDAAHHQVHAREIVGVFLELLSVVLNGVRVAIAARHGLADVDEQRARSTRGVVDGDVLASGQVPRDDLAHEHGNLVRGVELAGLFAGVGGEVADEVLVDEAQHVIVLTAIHRDVLDEVDEVAGCLGLAARIGAQLGEARLQRVEDAVEDALAGRVDVAAKGREGVAHVRYLEVAALSDPGGEEVVIGDEVAALALDEINRLLVVFHQAGQVLLGEVAHL